MAKAAPPSHFLGHFKVLMCSNSYFRNKPHENRSSLFRTSLENMLKYYYISQALITHFELEIKQFQDQLKEANEGKKTELEKLRLKVS